MTVLLVIAAVLVWHEYQIRAIRRSIRRGAIIRAMGAE